MPPFQKKHQCYGTTIVGERGQVVIPQEARDALKLKKSEKLLVFGMGTDMIMFTKIDALEKFAGMLEQRLTNVRSLLRTNKKR